jgi:hypothetical protein
MHLPKPLPKLFTASLIIMTVGSGGVALAANNISSTVTQTYGALPSVQTGMIVRLNPKDPSTVEPLSATSIDSMLGVVIPANNASIILSPQDSSKQQVAVANAGHYNVLVSNQNGPIAIGNYITISSLDGVGMKADTNQAEVLGKAAGTFNGTNNVIGSANLKNSGSHSTPVSIGRIPIDLGIAYNPLFVKTTNYVPGFLARVAAAIAGKPVSALRIYTGLAVLAASAFISGSMLASGVRGGMLAVGRNPLSRKSIIRSLLQAMVVGMVIFISGVIGVYLLLKL